MGVQDPQAGIAAETKAQRRERMEVREREGRGGLQQGREGQQPLGPPGDLLHRT